MEKIKKGNFRTEDVVKRALLITLAIPRMIKVAVYCVSTLWLPEI